MLPALSLRFLRLDRHPVPAYLIPNSPRPDPVNPEPSSLSGDRARTLLRRLRDLNLVAGPVALSREACVTIAGCLSLDGPAEAGVRYLLRFVDGSERTLEIGWNGAGLVMSVAGPGSSDLRTLRVPIACDREGRACVPAIGARVKPDTTDRRELEHFLRRVVRAVAR
ncbi:MAG: hypothetical protein JNK02_10860 [Planctomycetes bacterium]|nr:hypothetical protein [Planctomycetota bacterium]